MRVMKVKEGHCIYLVSPFPKIFTYHSVCNDVIIIVLADSLQSCWNYIINLFPQLNVHVIWRVTNTILSSCYNGLGGFCHLD